MNSFIRSYAERNMEILFCFNFSNVAMPIAVVLRSSGFVNKKAPVAGAL
jgi:hypothetical protein